MLGAAIVWVGAVAAVETPDPAIFEIESIVLPSPSVTLLLTPQAGRATVSAQWIFAVGSTDDPPDLQGLHHLLEHVAFARPSAAETEDYDTLLGRLGGESEGWTDRERMGFGAVVPALLAGGGAEPLLALEAERWAGLVINAESVTRQARVLMQESDERMSGAHGADRVLLDSLLWSADAAWALHPWAEPGPAIRAVASGAASAVETERLRVAVASAWASLHAPNVAVLALAGGLNADQVIPLVEPLFGATQAASGQSRSQPPDECEAAAPTRRYTKGSGLDGAIFQAWPVRGREHPDRPALELIARWMGGARTVSGENCGEFVVERRDRQGRLGVHAAALTRSLRSLVKTGLDPGQLRRTAMAQATDYARALDDPPLRARLAAGCWLSAKKASCVRDEMALWFGITSGSSQRAAARWLDPGAATTLVLGVRGPGTFPPIFGLSPW